MLEFSVSGLGFEDFWAGLGFRCAPSRKRGKIAFQPLSDDQGSKIRLGSDQGSKIKVNGAIRVRRIGLKATRVRR